MKISKLNGQDRKSLSKINPDIIYYHCFPKIEWNYIRPKSGPDQVRNHELTITILFGWGGLTIEL